MIEASYKLFFKAFSNKTRLEIINLLKKGPKSVSEICSNLGFEQSRVSHNLKCLEDCGVINSGWHGKSKIYELDKGPIIPILKNIDRHMKKYNERLKSCRVLKNEK